MNEDPDAIPGYLRCCQAGVFGSSHGEMCLAGLDHLDWLGMIIPNDINVRSRVRLLKSSGQGLDRGLFRSISDHDKVSGYLRADRPGNGCSHGKAQTRHEEKEKTRADTTMSGLARWIFRLAITRKVQGIHATMNQLPALSGGFLG